LTVRVLPQIDNAGLITPAPTARSMAGFGSFKAVTVDYRMPPTANFPGALDDGVTVYKNLLRRCSRATSA
jgi:acetyl esterase/lipase